jgi:NADPH-dependent 2,4-dienoyl-CoA reductase/sulfur reductase-like enzyme
MRGNMNQRILIIGGSDAGISAALRAREIDPHTEITVVLADRFPNYSICGLPYYLSGEVPDWRSLAHRTAHEIESSGILLLPGNAASKIDPVNRLVTAKAEGGENRSLPYDRLLIATGAVPVRPRIEGMDLPRVFTMRFMEDGLVLDRYLEEEKPGTALIVGGGYIGMEMADALRLRGLEVTVVEFFDSLLTTVDPELGSLVRRELEGSGVAVRTGTAVERIQRDREGLLIKGSDGFVSRANMVLVAVGARPETSLAEAAGIPLGVKGAIKVDRSMATGIPGVYAAGDCAETWHNLLDRSTYLPLGSTAHKQGRIAGENLAGGDARFRGTLGTQAVKIMGLVAARTGLRDREAREAGLDPLTNHFETFDHKAYYPHAHPIHIRITGEKKTGRLLGAQIVGRRESEISKRIDVIATAIYNRMAVGDLSHLDQSYTPPLSSPWDPLQMAAKDWIRIT